MVETVLQHPEKPVPIPAATSSTWRISAPESLQGAHVGPKEWRREARGVGKVLGNGRRQQRRQHGGVCQSRLTPGIVPDSNRNPVHNAVDCGSEEVGSKGACTYVWANRGCGNISSLPSYKAPPPPPFPLGHWTSTVSEIYQNRCDIVQKTFIFRIGTIVFLQPTLWSVTTGWYWVLNG